MGYALQSLLRIRAMREDRAAGEMTAARQVVAAAQETLAARRRDLAQYEATREERRDRIFETVIGRAVTLDQLDLAKEGVARIDEEGILKADNVRQAEAKLHESEAAETVAREKFNLATKNRMKIDEHKAVWLDEERKEEEARAEGFEEIAQQFEGVAAIEKHHEERYLKLLANIEKGEVWEKVGENRWQCRNCGHIYIGEKAPEVCPVCNHPQAYFQVEPENY